MGEARRMPARSPLDGAVAFERVGNGFILRCGDQSMFMMPFNAWRIIGMMSIVLGLPLSQAAKKAIRFDAEGDGHG